MKLYSSIRIEGGLFGPDLLDMLSTADLVGQRAQDFGFPPRRNLTDEIAAAFNDARTLWGVFHNRLDRLPENDMATSLTRDSWAIPFLGLLGYELRYNPRAYEVDGLTFAISHRAGEEETSPPVHIVGVRQELGRLSPSGRPRLSPHALLQEFLNRGETLWGIVTNGKTLRLLRDSTFVRRQSYVEFDLEEIFSEDRFADFVILFRLLHRTRFPQPAGEPQNCLLEQYYARSVEQGGRVRDHLREGVEACLGCLANGFLSHPASEDLRIWLRNDDGPVAFYRELLRLVYRFLFLLVSEERGLISSDPIYLDHYSITRLRRLIDQRAAYTEDDDLWQSLRVLWFVETDDQLSKILGLSPLNGELFAPLHLENATITNRDLLDAFWRLSYYQENHSAPPRRVNYAALDTEELGSVYESLLEFHPEVDWHGNQAFFELVALGDERRSTGSHYTPPELVAPLIQHTLEPVLSERLKTAVTKNEKVKAILGIKVCDPACGSGHFLLAAARRLGKELARVSTGEDEPAPERVRDAIRDVVAHCIYGVDKNPLAIELCRVALWLESNAEGKPLTFLEHHIRCGDSLVGVADLSVLKEGIPDEAFRAVGDDVRAVATGARNQNRAEREGQLGLFTWDLEAALEWLSEENKALDAIPDDTPEQVRRKRQQYQRRFTDPNWLRQKEACDLWTAAFFQPLERERPIITTAAVRSRLADQALSPQMLAYASVQSETAHYFHWALEFPEVFKDGGFDVILGNPPFMGGLRISGSFGSCYRRWLEIAFTPYGGTADLCAAFFRRGFQSLKSGGRIGLIATNTIGQGDTRESGLAILIRKGGSITFARRFVKWPGRANVEVNLIAVSRKKAQANFYLDGQVVEFISSRLDQEPEAEPKSLKSNEGKSFQGDIVRGLGFVLDSVEAEQLLSSNPRNADCLFPYLNGEDLNSHPQQQPSRWVICFHDWELRRAQQYPELLRIVEERVKPDRVRLAGPGDRRNREFWWQFGAFRTGMRAAISPLDRVLIRAEVSQTHSVAFVPKHMVFSHMLIVFAFDDDYHFALLQSNLHEAWVWRNASSLESRNRYTPTDCFATFPFPQTEYEIDDLAELLQMPAFAEAARLGGEYHEYRRQVMLTRQLGLTKTYNLFNSPECADEDIACLRSLHAEMDNAILACYGWQDLDLQHDFYPNDRGQIRFTISPDARRTLLRRLLELNLQIAESETALPGSTSGGPKKVAEKKSRYAAKPRAREAPGQQPELQMSLPEPDPPEEAEVQVGPSDFGLYRCMACGDRVLGFDKENHIREAHGGQRVEFKKV